MRIAFFGDLHLDPATAINTRPAAVELVKAIAAVHREKRLTLIANLGDLSWKRGHLAPWVALELRSMHVELTKLAAVCVVAGNHDLGSGGEVGTVLGALSISKALPGMLSLFERPGFMPIFMDKHNEYIACLPYPSRHWLLANRPDLKGDEINAALSEALTDVVRGLAAQVPEGKTATLLFHGSIAGARSDSEQMMSTEIDVVLNEADIPACFTHVLCGHIHRRQQIGRAIYPGSPAPLTFAEEQHPHGFGVLDTDSGQVEWHELPVAHRLLTINDADAALPDEVLTGGASLSGARVRLKARLKAGETAGEVRDYWVQRMSALGAEEVRVQIEREGSAAATHEINEKAGLPALIDLYLARRPDVADVADDLRALAASLDSGLAPEARAVEQAGSYRLCSLKWDNWKSYGPGNELVLSELAGTVSIEGGNAIGKSNAAEVECFALYGRTPRGRVPLGELVRQGEKDARVTAEIEAQGQRWKIERRLKVNGKGLGSADLTLYREAPVDSADAWAPASLGTAVETQARIASLVGPFELYLSTRFASQGDIDRLVDLTGSEMKDTLQAVLATSVFEAREALGRCALARAEREQEKHTAGLAAWIEAAGMREAREAAARDGAADLASAESDHLIAADACEASRLALVAASAQLQGIQQQIKEWDRSAENLSKASGRAVAFDQSLTADRKSTEDAAHLNEQEIATGTEAAQLRVSELKERRAREEGSRSAVSEAEHGLASARSAIESHLALRRGKLESMERDLLRLTEQMQEAEAQGSLVSEVPFGEKCLPCPLLKGAVAARNRLADLGVRRNGITVERDAYAVAPDPRLADLQSIARSAESRLETARAQLAEPVDELALKRAEQALKEWHEQGRQLNQVREARARIAANAPALAALQDEVERLTDAHAAMGDRPDASLIASSLRIHQEAHTEGKREVEHAQEKLANAQRALARADAELALSLEAEQRLNAAETVGAQLERALRVARLYLEAVGRDGIPYMMLERALPALEAHANHFLCADQGSGLSVEVDGLRELQSGERRLDVVIRYSNAFGTHSLSAASGFERTAIGYALRASLAQVQAETQGVRIEHWIADEGWGVFDESNLVAVGQPMVRRLAETFGRVILISHQAPIREVCESRFEVVGDPTSGSALRRIA